MQQHFARELRKVGESAKQAFETVTDNWDNKPTFRSAVTEQGPVITITVTTDSIIFHWVDQGTQPHSIPRSGPATMAFPSGYRPRTSPGRLQFNAQGGQGFGETVFTQSVEHPGIEPRKFTDRVKTQTQKDALRVLGQSLRNLPR